MINVDHHQWGFDDVNCGVSEIQKLAEHFSVPLLAHKVITRAAVFKFQQLKKLVHAKYLHMQLAMILWDKIFQQHLTTFLNMLAIVEIILHIICLSNTVEHGFSTLNGFLTSAGKSFWEKQVNDLMIIRVIVPILTSLDPNCVEKLAH